MESLDVIAKTGFGYVERVRLKDGSIAARKVLQPSDTILRGVNLPDLRKRFAREVRVQRALPDQFVVPILFADLDADPPSFVMPLAEATFEHQMSSLKGNPPELLAAFGQVLDALGALHALGYAHRDLKPSNILLHEGRWKLADLGLVLPIEANTTKLTVSNQAWGTPAYGAPEQFVDFKRAGCPADIFAFGCILHDCFGNSTRAPCQRLSAPGKIACVIEKSTELDPKKRFKSVDRLRAALFEVLATPPEIPVETEATLAAAHWAAKLENIDAMQVPEFADMARFVRGVEHPAFAGLLFSALTEERIVRLKERDPDSWVDIANQYCEWAKSPNFDFNYCDVLALRLRIIYDHGTVGIKANAVLATAILAEQHNRWFVMNRLFDVCGPDMDSNVAQRVAIEIRACEFENEFRRCAAVISRSVGDYHPVICAVLPPLPPPAPVPVPVPVPPNAPPAKDDIFSF
jgi:hypothetical protein